MSLPSAYNTFSQNRYIRGPLDTAVYPAASGYQTNVGDLVLFFSGLAFPATAWGNVLPYSSGTEIQNWSGARGMFAGVSISQNNSTSVVSGQLTVATQGVFEYPTPTSSGANVQPGTYLSFTQDPVNGQVGSGFLSAQSLAQASGNTTAIGKAVELVPVNTSGTGVVKVYLQSFLEFGGIGA